MTTSLQALDSPEPYRRYDPSGVLQRIASLPDQFQEAWDRAWVIPLPAGYAEVQHIAFLGVGGSAIGGDLVKGLADLECALPITVLRGYQVPEWVGPNTLVIASSYSGNTEETLSMYRVARERKAVLAVVTSGGALLEMARAEDVPVVKVTHRGEARSAMGYSFMAPLAILCQLGILPYDSGAVAGAVQLLRELSEALAPQAPAAQNLAKTIAGAMHGKQPIIYGAGFLTGAARRWKTQLNENSKSWAFFEELPELAHNSVEGLALPQAARDRAFVTLLHSDRFHHRISAKYQEVEEVLVQKGVAYRQIDAVGDTALAHLLTSVLLGDYVSYYLALLNSVDPSPTPVLEQIKQQMARE
ncbi:MAG: bifunctional phosphoglucose/phosphomannose isomerase [Chloroflexi bacterium]|nr:bifunctional phosphoglucose/phosphomannose isomerase [Chloroflexota bacterium]